MTELLVSVFLPFVGTTLGASGALFMKNNIHPMVRRCLAGFAGGVMVAASVWSLLLPALEQAENMGKLSFAPAVIGFWLGILFLLTLDKAIPHLHIGGKHAEGPASKLSKTVMLVLAVVLHNIPEGMAVGVLYAGWSTGAANVSLAAALTLSLGIALQNFPEGAIVSMPLRGDGVGRGKAFGLGTLSGAVEPIAALITILLAEWIAPALPYLLGFAAGAMMYVVVEELIPEMSEGEHSNIGTLCFAAGFTAMIILDVLLG